MKIIILAAAMAALATPVFAADSKPKVDRVAALARAPQFHDQVEAALTRNPNDLYLAALTGSANDRWVWGLAIVATRYDTTSVPPAQLATFKAYNAKVSAARDAYAKKHPKEDASDKPMDFFVKPTDEEAQAVSLVQAINSANLWLNKAHDGGIDAALLNQSVQCLNAAKGVVDAEVMMGELMSGLDSVASDEPSKSGSKSSGDAVDLTAILNAPKDEADKSNEEKDR